MSLALDFRDEIEEVARRATPSHQPFGSVHRRGLFIGDFRCPQMGVDPLSLEDKNQFIGKGLLGKPKLGGFLLCRRCRDEPSHQEPALEQLPGPHGES